MRVTDLVILYEIHECRFVLARYVAGEAQARAFWATTKLQPVCTNIEERGQILDFANDIRSGRLLPNTWQPRASSFNSIEISLTALYIDWKPYTVLRYATSLGNPTAVAASYLADFLCSLTVGTSNMHTKYRDSSAASEFFGPFQDAGLSCDLVSSAGLSASEFNLTVSPKTSC
jgi:hypothetical protein